MTATESPEKQPLDTSAYTALEPLANDLLKHWNVPGVAVGILRDGQVETWGFGLANIETQQAMTADHLLQIGSISKVFTTTLVMLLVDEGKIDLDEPVRTYLPDLELKDADALATITMRHLVTHTSGLFGDFFEDFGVGDDALSKAIAQYGTLRQITTPGEIWSYCNSGFNLAGAIIEKILDMPFEQAMQEKVFAPLGLDHSFFFAAQAIVYPVAVGHVETEPGSGKIEVARAYQLPRAVNPAGGIIATVADLLGFAKFHINNGKVDDEQILSEESVRAMQEIQTSAANFAQSWGLGWDINDLDGVRVVGHGGSTNGFQARLSVVPSKGYAIAILTDGDDGWAVNSALNEWALREHCGLSDEKPAPVDLTPVHIANMAGTYESQMAVLTLSPDNGSLRIDARTKVNPLSPEERELPPSWVWPISDYECISTTGPTAGTRTDFIADDNGRTRFIRLGGRVYDRVDD